MLSILRTQLQDVSTEERRDGAKIRVITTDGIHTSNTTMRVFKQEDVSGEDQMKNKESQEKVSAGS